MRIGCVTYRLLQCPKYFLRCSPPINDMACCVLGSVKTCAIYLRILYLWNCSSSEAHFGECTLYAEVPHSPEITVGLLTPATNKYLKQATSARSLHHMGFLFFWEGCWNRDYDHTTAQETVCARLAKLWCMLTCSHNWTEVRLSLPFTVHATAQDLLNPSLPFFAAKMAPSCA